MKLLFIASIVLVLAAATAHAAIDVTDALAVDPASIELLSLDANQPPQEVARAFILDVGLPSVSVLDNEGMSVIDSFIQDAQKESKKRYGALGRKWSQFKKIVGKAEKSALAKEAKAAAASKLSPFNKQTHHGLTSLEYRYMRMYRKYMSLQKAYRKGCGKSRFWLNLNKWHWQVLVSASKRLKKLLALYKTEHNAYRTQKSRLAHRFSWVTKRAYFKSPKFFRKVIAHSKLAIKATEQKIAKVQSEKDMLKEKATNLANKMNAAALLDTGVKNIAAAVDHMQAEMNTQQADDDGDDN